MMLPSSMESTSLNAEETVVISGELIMSKKLLSIKRSRLFLQVEVAAAESVAVGEELYGV